MLMINTTIVCRIFQIYNLFPHAAGAAYQYLLQNKEILQTKEIKKNKENLKNKFLLHFITVIIENFFSFSC